MYVCPKCEEEIPDRVKKNSEECPFCHEPWPPDELDEPEPAAEEKPKKKGGWGDEFKPSAAVDPSQVHHEEPKKSKTWLFVVIGVLVIGGGAGAYFALGGKKAGKGGKGGGAAASGKVNMDEIGAIDSWYRQARKKLNNYLGAQCSSFADKGYHVQTTLKKNNHIKTVKGKKVTTFDFSLNVKPGGGKASGPLNIFECPVKIAEIQRDHPLIMEAEIWEKREVFGAVYLFANITIKGKTLPKTMKKRVVKRNVVLQSRKGFAFSRMKNLPKTPEYEGFRALSTEMPFRIGGGARSFTMGNLTWKRFKPGKYIQGSWRMTMQTKEFAKMLKDWDDGCFGLRKHIRQLDKPKKNHRLHFKLTHVERAVTKELCTALHKLAEATKGDKVDQAGLNQAKALLDAARAKWNKELYGKLKSEAKKLDTTIIGKPL